MSRQLYTNNADTLMSGTLSQGGTTLVVATGTGSRFPSISGADYFLLTLLEKDVSGLETRIEVVKVTARVADTLTIVRDFEGTVGVAGGYAYPSVVGSDVTVSLRLTAGSATAMLQSGANLSDLTNPTTARANLGAAAATHAHPDNVTPVAVNTTAVAFGTYVLTTTLVLTLPAAPAAGDWVTVVNFSGATIVARNGSKIMGLAEDHELNRAPRTVTFLYVNSTLGWVLT